MVLEKRERRWLLRRPRPTKPTEVDDMITKHAELFDIEPNTIDLTDPPLFGTRPAPVAATDLPPLFAVDESQLDAGQLDDNLFGPAFKGELPTP